MKASDIKTMADDQLTQHVQKVREELFNLRFQHATGELENTAKIGQVKKELACTLTIAHERDLKLHEVPKFD